jgi:hypothetical protein
VLTTVIGGLGMNACSTPWQVDSLRLKRAQTIGS